MITLRSIFILLLQMSMIILSSDKEEYVLSKEDDAWLGKNPTLFLNEEKPQVHIASRMIFLDHKKFSSDFDNTYLQKNITHAKNWLRYFNEKKELDEKGRLEFCHELKFSALFIKSIKTVGITERETTIFLPLFDYGINIKDHTLINGNSFIHFYHKICDYPALVNNFIYYYKPSLNFFVQENDKQPPYLKVIVDYYENKNTLCQCFLADLAVKDLKTVFRPALYRITDKEIIKESYKDIQKYVMIFLCSIKHCKKLKNLTPPKPVVNTIILASEFSFLRYCNQVQDDIIEQIMWITNNDLEYYKKKLSQFEFLQRPEAFKKWYGKLKRGNKKLEC